MKLRSRRAYVIKCVFMLVFLVLVVLTVYNTLNHITPLIMGLNNNIDDRFTESAGIYFDGEESMDKYGAGQVLYTILSDKEVVLSRKGFFRIYAVAMFNNVSFDDTLPDLIDFSDLPGKEKYINLGISLAGNHKTLFSASEVDIVNRYDPYIYVNPDGLEECKKVVLVNDDKINMYITSADVWYGNTYSEGEEGIIGDIIRSTTEKQKYRIHSIFGAMLIFALGYFAMFFCLRTGSGALRLFIAFPTGTALWVISSLILLLAHIHYSLTTGIICCILIECLFAVIFFKKLKSFQLKEAVMHFTIAMIAGLFLSSGTIPILNTYDSYLFIYDYGNLLYNNAVLDFSYVGCMMGGTSIVPALMVAFMRFIGAESLMVIHGLLIFSEVGCLAYYIHKDVSKKYGKKYGICATLFSILFLAFIPSVLRLELTVNSLSYFMVFVTIFFLLVLHIEDFSNEDSIDIILSLFFLTLAFLRIEGAVATAFFAFCIGVKITKRRRMAVITFSAVIFQCVYFVEILLDKRFYRLDSKDFFLSKSACFIIFSSLLLIVLFVMLYSKKLVLQTRSKFTIICFLGLPLMCIVIGLFYRSKFMTNAVVVLKNLTSEGWNYYMYILLAVIAMTIVGKLRVEWIDCVVIGYVFLNFGLCLGRELPLREGWGDSYNRMLCAIVPLSIYAIIIKVMQFYGKCFDEYKNKRRTT